MIGTRRDPTVLQNTIREDKLKWLGRVGGFDYATHNGKEYCVDADASLPGDLSSVPGQIYVTRVARETIDGSELEHHRTHRGVPVPPGTFAALQQREQDKAERRARRANPPLRSWDVLAPMRAMRRREPTRVPTAPMPSNNTLGELKATLGHAGYVEAGGYQPPERSAAGIVAALTSHGIELSMAGNRLLARSRTLIKADDQELIEAAEELIVGVLTDSPVACSLCPEAAVSVAFPDAPMCATHLEGE